MYCRTKRCRSLVAERLEARELLAIDLSPSVAVLNSEPSFAETDESFGYGVFSPSRDDHKIEHVPLELREIMFGDGIMTDAYEDRQKHSISPGAFAVGPNITVIDAHLRNGAGTRISSPVVGERVAVQVNFSTMDLPAGISYRISYVVDGVTLESGNISAGANGVNGNFFFWRSGWFAASGNHSASVLVDAYNTVAENNEADNAYSFNFTAIAATFSQKLIWPIEGDPFSDTNFGNYVDLDPLSSSVRDYQNGTVSYDGHDAWDIGPWTFHEQELGIELYAAADGVVSGVFEGAYDRQITWITPAPPAVPDIGTWMIDFRVNGSILGSTSFDVTAAGAPEVRVEDSLSNMILDGRATPLAFGTVARGASATPITLQVRNHGQAPLTITIIQVPPGFALIDGLPSQIAAGASDALTVSMNTSVAGYNAGRVRIFSNDLDEVEYDFAIEGYVTAVGNESLTVGIGQPDLREGDRTIANVRRTGSTAQSLIVSLLGDTTQLLFPSQIVIPAGQSWVNFFVDGFADLTSEPQQLLSLLAQATGFSSARNELALSDLAPSVLNIFASGSNWSSTFIDAIDGGGVGTGNGLGYAFTPGVTLANSGFDRLYIQFNRPVTGFASSNLSLFGVDVGDYSTIATATYDIASMLGIVQLSSSIHRDKLRFGLIGNAILDSAGTALDGDTNGAPGGILDFRFNVLVGDANSDGSVNGGDLPIFAASFNTSAGNVAYNPRADWNSDGSVNGGDLPLFAARFNQSLPVGEPAALNFPPPLPIESETEWTSVPIIDEDDVDNYFKTVDRFVLGQTRDSGFIDLKQHVV